MKRVFCLLLCLVLALAAPLSALAEPQSWLLPLTKRGDAVKSAEAVMTAHIDPEAVNALVDWLYDKQLQSYEEMAKSWAAYYEEQYKEQEEAPDETNEFDSFYDTYIQNAKKNLNTARATVKAYVPGAAALADASEILVHSGENLSAWEYRVDGTSWFTVNLISRPEEGDALLTSDLFPSCALSIPLRVSSSDAFGESVQKLLALWQELLPTLAEYEGFDLLGQLYEADVQALALLEAEGLAHREGDALVYEHTVSLPGVQTVYFDEALDALYQRHAMDVDERVYKLHDLATQLYEAVSSIPASDIREETPDTLPVLGEDATDKEYANAYNEYRRMMYKNCTQTTTVSQRVTLENNNEIINEVTTTVATHYEPFTDETGTLEKLRERYESLSYNFKDYEYKTLVAARYTPTAMEYHRLNANYQESVFRLDASAENEILFSFTGFYDGSGGAHRTMRPELLLTRTDEGQQWTLTIPMGMIGGDEDEEPLRVALSLDNDINWMNLALSMLGRELGSIRAEYAYSDEPAALPDVSGLTVIPYDDTEAMKALYTELRTVAVPKLTKLITIGLPKGAKGLIMPLLGLVASLGQIGK